ncbi:beta-N-acetylhexosaminidase [Agrococcus carbonis]|uniref:Beta-N-acetylhexosaminidase n=2 Tax=Agrococcus carbonis TaxID=684552 RepID=A0A1H1NNF5_9MICO|nr:beta-N-acetylhexosaminidase [Agrococcus carbonis]
MIAALLALSGLLAGCAAPASVTRTAPSASQSARPDASAPTPPLPLPPPPLAWGPTQAQLDEGIEAAAAMPTADAAGQVVVAQFAGTDPDAAAQQVRELGLAGVILFAPNASGPDGVRAIADAVQAAGAERRDWPTMVAVDEEGGIVQRLGGRSGWPGMPPFLASGAAVAGGDAQPVHDAYRALGDELRAVGITTDFAPVADVTIGPRDAAIGTRSASGDPAVASEAAAAAARGLSAGGVLAAAKHFPGHGALTVDSHEALPEQSASDAELAARDLVPFEAAIDAGAPMVMMGHIAVDAWDPGVPATLSPAAYERLRALGFTGVAITDSLGMGALAAFGDSGTIAVQALRAGADLLLTPPDAAAAVRGITDAVESGALPRARLDEAAGRVIAMQRWQARIAERADITGVEASTAAAADASAALSAAAITLVSGPCSGPLVGPRVQLLGGTDADRAAMTDALHAHGLQAVSGSAADSTVRLLRGASGGGSADAAVALDWPHALAGTSAPVRIAAFGRTAGAFDAVAAVLAGDAVARGRLPVAVEGLPASGC